MSNPKNSLPTVQRKSIEEATAEAESRVLDYQPKERASYIRNTMRTISEWITKVEEEKTIRERLPEFVEQYPELFKKMMARQDLTPIHTMLALLDKMGEGKISQHQASIAVGQKLVDTYVTPALKKK
jgi:hypothetical protein